MMDEKPYNREKMLKDTIKTKIECVNPDTCLHKVVATGDCMHKGSCKFKKVMTSSNVWLKSKLMKAVEKAIDDVMRDV